MQQEKKDISVDMLHYVDNRFEELEKYIDKQFELDRKAVDQYSKTNDEWKLLHNDLQRKMEHERVELKGELMQVLKDMQEASAHAVQEKVKLLQAKIVIAIAAISLLVTVYEIFMS